MRFSKDGTDSPGRAPDYPGWLNNADPAKEPDPDCAKLKLPVVLSQQFQEREQQFENNVSMAGSEEPLRRVFETNRETRRRKNHRLE
jgi:hypothetical protein